MGRDRHFGLGPSISNWRCSLNPVPQYGVNNESTLDEQPERQGLDIPESRNFEAVPGKGGSSLGVFHSLQKPDIVPWEAVCARALAQ